jgi:hypothetical protein
VERGVSGEGLGERLIQLPTDLQILEAIYDRYYHEFANFSTVTPDRPAKAFVKIDSAAIAAKLHVDVDIVLVASTTIYSGSTASRKTTIHSCRFLPGGWLCPGTSCIFHCYRLCWPP